MHFLFRLIFPYHAPSCSLVSVMQGDSSFFQLLPCLHACKSVSFLYLHGLKDASGSLPAPQAARQRSAEASEYPPLVAYPVPCARAGVYVLQGPAAHILHPNLSPKLFRKAFRIQIAHPPPPLPILLPTLPLALPLSLNLNLNLNPNLSPKLYRKAFRTRLAQPPPLLPTLLPILPLALPLSLNLNLNLNPNLSPFILLRSSRQKRLPRSRFTLPGPVDKPSPGRACRFSPPTFIPLKSQYTVRPQEQASDLRARNLPIAECGMRNADWE